MIVHFKWAQTLKSFWRIRISFAEYFISLEADIANIVADFHLLEQLKEVRGIIVSAKGDTVDFVSRFFAPQSGIREDMVTGSAHTSLTPYWSQKLGKNELVALQLSSRKGYLYCKDEGSRIKIAGKAKTFSVARIEVTNFI